MLGAAQHSCYGRRRAYWEPQTSGKKIKN